MHKISSFASAQILAVLTVMSFSTLSSAAPTCGSFLTSKSIETIRGIEVPVTSYTTQSRHNKSHPGIGAQSLFGLETGVIFGVDTTNNRQPYLIVGDKTFMVTKSRTEMKMILIYNDTLKTSQPHFHNETIYQVGVVDGANLRPGYFVRLPGISPHQVGQIKARMTEFARRGSENGSWTGVVSNLKNGFVSASGVDLNCDSTKCEYIGQLLNKAVESGFVDASGKAIAPEFYVLDYPDFNSAVKSEQRRMTASRIGFGIVATGVGAAGVAMGGLAYNVIAMIKGWPLIPLPF